MSKTRYICETDLDSSGTTTTNITDEVLWLVAGCQEAMAWLKKNHPPTITAKIEDSIRVLYIDPRPKKSAFGGRAELTVERGENDDERPEE